MSRALAAQIAAKVAPRAAVVSRRLPARAYHGTAASFAPSIDHDGLHPGVHDAVWVTDDSAMAAIYGCWAAIRAAKRSPDEAPRRAQVVVYELGVRDVLKVPNYFSSPLPLPWQTTTTYAGEFVVNGSVTPDRLGKVTKLQVDELTLPGMLRRANLEYDLVHETSRRGSGAAVQRVTDAMIGPWPRNPGTAPGGRLLRAALDACDLTSSRLHGEDHWRAVVAQGLQIIHAGCRADPAVVYAFGVLHDAQRETEGRDPAHGIRAARLAGRLRDRYLKFSALQMDLLTQALEEHSEGSISDDPTIGACWDADRLALPRVGCAVDPDYLSTREARALAAAGTVIRACDWDWVTYRYRLGTKLAGRLANCRSPGVWFGDHRDSALRTAA